ncbi:MAG: RNA-binding protein [Candidatus Saganbacteria bacterium]|nr:RNA-binding protein [Candidatus Saganbacteria bacterium]
MKSLFIGNLPWSVKDEDLQTKFSEFGEVSSARVITDKFTGRSRGFGFVDMPNDEEAQKAITAMNGFSMDGREITVNEARPKTENRERRDGGGGGGGGGRNDFNRF